MATVTENDLKELKDLILSNQKALETRFTGLETRFTGIEKGQTEMKERLAVIETRLEDWKPSIDKIPDLAEKVGELKNWRQIIIMIITATVSGVVGWLVRGGNLRP